jgi:hypothetical protein
VQSANELGGVLRTSAGLSYEDFMLTIAMRTLFVGSPSPQITAILTRLGQKGFGSYAADAAPQGHELLEAGKFELVIALEKIEGGEGYEFAGPVKRKGGSLFVGIETSNDRLWVPVIDHGETVLGGRAVDYSMLEGELEDVLTHRSPCAKPVSRWIPAVAPRVSETTSRVGTIAAKRGEERTGRPGIAEVPARIPGIAVRSLLRVPREAEHSGKEICDTSKLTGRRALTRAKAIGGK